MSELVPFHCPEHGWVLDTFASAHVMHGRDAHSVRCGRNCAPQMGGEVAHRRASARRQQAARKRKSLTRGAA